jgi:serine O-acetyltransferase
MINSLSDYKFYLEADRVSLRIEEVLKHKSNLAVAEKLEIWKFQRLLRKVEYYQNCKCKESLWIPYYKILLSRFIKLSEKLTYSIPPNVFGPGLAIKHRGTIIVAETAKIGANCNLHTCTNIGVKAGEPHKVPNLGDNIYIGPGVKIFGDVKIADNVAIGANAVVNKSFLEPDIAIAGVPAKKINSKGSTGIVRKATEIVRARRLESYEIIFQETELSEFSNK